MDIEKLYSFFFYVCRGNLIYVTPCRIYWLYIFLFIIFILLFTNEMPFILLCSLLLNNMS